MKVKELISLHIDGIRHIQIAEYNIYRNYDCSIDESFQFDVHYNEILHDDLLTGVYSNRTIYRVEYLLNPDNDDSSQVCIDYSHYDEGFNDDCMNVYQFAFRFKPTLRIIVN